MQTFEPLAGTHIGHACAEAVKIAGESGEPCAFTFNDIEMVADGESTPARLIETWEGRMNQSRMNQRRAEYLNSIEGKAAELDRLNRIRDKQAEINMLIRDLPSVLSKDLDALIEWLRAFVDPSDTVGVGWDRKQVIALLTDAGYVENEHVGQSPEWLNTRDRMGRYLVGQAITCMSRGMGPHPITLSFAEKYFALPPATNVPA